MSWARLCGRATKWCVLCVCVLRVCIVFVFCVCCVCVCVCVCACVCVGMCVVCVCVCVGHVCFMGEIMQSRYEVLKSMHPDKEIETVGNHLLRGGCNRLLS